MTSGARDKSWWTGAVMYQLYVRSWRDTNGDGYGDLPGIIEQLDHLSWLGVDAIWLSPTMPSPDDDWGYDVSDYMRVHPELGTLADLDGLIAEAAAGGCGCCSTWCPTTPAPRTPGSSTPAVPRCGAPRLVRLGRPGPGRRAAEQLARRDRRPAWTLDTATGQYYLHNFLPSPARPELVGARGPRGVRGDPRLLVRPRRGRVPHRRGARPVQGRELRDNPPCTSGPLIGGVRPGAALQRQPARGARRLPGLAQDRRELRPAPAAARRDLGPGLERLARYYGDDDELQLAFNFPFVFAGFTAPELSQVVRETLAGCPPGRARSGRRPTTTWRFPTRWCGGDERKAALALLVLLTLPGTTVLYYGDEIGMTDVEVPVELRRDNMTLGGPGGTEPGPGQDADAVGARATGGFTAAGTTPWLPVGDASAQRRRPAGRPTIAALALSPAHGGPPAAHQGP